VKDIQSGINAALQSMNTGTGEVETGAGLVKHSGETLSKILESVRATNDRIQGIANAAARLAAGSEDVVTAVGSMTAITEKSVAATQEMAAGSGQVGENVSSIAAVARESAAAAQEVSASAEELSASTDEIARQAEDLSRMAAELAGEVARFKV